MGRINGLIGDKLNNPQALIGAQITTETGETLAVMGVSMLNGDVFLQLNDGRSVRMLGMAGVRCSYWRRYGTRK